tara:strand:+ start:68 stop:457 length:390 start_codon:yes stop_codon:yes gene_type:complete
MSKLIYTKDFNPNIDVKLLCTCGEPLCDKRSVSQDHLNRVQIARTFDGNPWSVTSGGRCKYHPNEIDRTTPADHQKGQGIDVLCNGFTRGNIVNAGIKAGCNAIGVAKTFVHLGFRYDLPSGHITMWVY